MKDERVRVRVTYCASGEVKGWYDTTQSMANQLITSYGNKEPIDGRIIIEVESRMKTIDIYVVMLNDPNSSDSVQALAGYGTYQEAQDGIEVIAREFLEGDSEEGDEVGRGFVQEALKNGDRFSNYLFTLTGNTFDIVTVLLHVEELR